MKLLFFNPESDHRIGAFQTEPIDGIREVLTEYSFLNRAALDGSNHVWVLFGIFDDGEIDEVMNHVWSCFGS